MRTKNLKIALLACAASAVWMSPVRADILVLGGSYSYPVPLLEDNVATSEGGGSIDPSTLDGTPTWVYCVDLYHNVNVPGTFNVTISTAGVVNGATVNNAGEVAWLLENYGGTGQAAPEVALQAAIWHVIYDGSAGYAGGHTVSLNTAAATSAEVTDYNNILSALGSHTGNLAGIDWLTLSPSDNIQGLVALPVPEPTTVLAGVLMLLPFGASTLRFVRKNRTA